MNGYEIINRVDLKKKYGTGSDIIDALSRCRSFFSRVGKEWNENNKAEKHYFLMNEFEKHLMIIQDSHILTKRQDSTSENKNRSSKASKLSPTPEVNNQPLQKKLKTNSYDINIPNISLANKDLKQVQKHNIMNLIKIYGAKDTSNWKSAKKVLVVLKFQILAPSIHRSDCRWEQNDTVTKNVRMKVRQS